MRDSGRSFLQRTMRMGRVPSFHDRGLRFDMGDILLNTCLYRQHRMSSTRTCTGTNDTSFTINSTSSSAISAGLGKDFSCLRAERNRRLAGQRMVFRRVTLVHDLHWRRLLHRKLGKKSPTGSVLLHWKHRTVRCCFVRVVDMRRVCFVWGRCCE